MKPVIEILGKVVPTVEGDWNIKNKYSEISIVFDNQSNKSYISKKEVPAGISILNKEYWHIFGNTRIDSDSILLLSRIENGIITSYTLEEAINSISVKDRRIGMFISFYEKPTKDILNYRWNLYQFNSNNIDDFLDITAWDSIYYPKTKFYGLFVNEEDLYNAKKNPSTGDYAFVGNSLGEANVYVCRIKNVWTPTKEKATEFISIKIQGTVTVGENGNWFNNGIDTGISAKGEKGDKPYLRYNEDTKSIEYSFDKINWELLVLADDITASATIEIGKVTYGKGVHPTVNNSGTKAAAIFDFILPDTNSIKIGNVKTLIAGSKATVVNSGTAYDAIFDFGIPMGNPGVQGEKGDTTTIKGIYDTEEELKQAFPDGDNNNAYLVGTSSPYNLYLFLNNDWIKVGSINQIEAGVFDGGRADSVYGGARTINCGNAETIY